MINRKHRTSSVFLLVAGLLAWFQCATALGATIASPSRESTSDLTAEEWKKEAIEKFPELAIAGSPLNAEFVARYKAYQGSNFFNSPDWPMRLAKECAHVAPVPNQASLAQRLAKTTWKDANKVDSQGNQKSFTLNADMTARASWRHKELGSWKLLDYSRIELQIDRNTWITHTLTFNKDLTEATDENNQSYHRINPPVSPIAIPVPAGANSVIATQPGVPGLQEREAAAPSAPPVTTSTPGVNAPMETLSSAVPALVTKSGKTYERWSIAGTNGDIVTVSYVGGMARVPISDFPDDLSQYPADAVAPIQKLRDQAAAMKIAEEQKAAAQAQAIKDQEAQSALQQAEEEKRIEAEQQLYHKAEHEFERYAARERFHYWRLFGASLLASLVLMTITLFTKKTLLIANASLIAGISLLVLPLLWLPAAVWLIAPSIFVPAIAARRASDAAFQEDPEMYSSRIRHLLPSSVASILFTVSIFAASITGFLLAGNEPSFLNTGWKSLDVNKPALVSLEIDRSVPKISIPADPLLASNEQQACQEISKLITAKNKLWLITRIKTENADSPNKFAKALSDAARGFALLGGKISQVPENYRIDGPESFGRFGKMMVEMTEESKAKTADEVRKYILVTSAVLQKYGSDVAVQRAAVRLQASLDLTPGMDVNMDAPTRSLYDTYNKAKEEQAELEARKEKSIEEARQKDDSRPADSSDSKPVISDDDQTRAYEDDIRARARAYGMSEDDAVASFRRNKHDLMYPEDAPGGDNDRAREREQDRQQSGWYNNR
jgi:uncharacterized membrane protein YhaH (DUF805 family)